MGRQKGGSRRRKFARDRKAWRPWPEDGRQFQRHRQIERLRLHPEPGHIAGPHCTPECDLSDE